MRTISAAPATDLRGPHRALDEACRALTSATESLSRVSGRNDADPEHNSGQFEAAARALARAEALQRRALARLGAQPIRVPDAPRPLPRLFGLLLGGRHMDKARAIDAILEIDQARKRLAAHLPRRPKEEAHEEGSSETPPCLEASHTSDLLARPTRVLGAWWGVTLLLVALAVLLQLVR